MFSKELSELLFQVVMSWQVIAVTVALVFYIYLVNYVTRSYHRPHFVSRSKPKKVKPSSKAASKTTIPS